MPPAAGIISQPIIDVKPARANFELHENCSQSLCVSVSPPVLERQRRQSWLASERAGGRRRGARAGAPHARTPRRGAQTQPGRPGTGQGASRRRAARPPEPRARRAHASHQAKNSPAAVRLRATGWERKERLLPPRATPPAPSAHSGVKGDFLEEASEREIQIKTSTHLRESA